MLQSNFGSLSGVPGSNIFPVNMSQVYTSSFNCTITRLNVFMCSLADQMYQDKELVRAANRQFAGRYLTGGVNLFMGEQKEYQCSKKRKAVADRCYIGTLKEKGQGWDTRRGLIPWRIVLDERSNELVPDIVEWGTGEIFVEYNYETNRKAFYFVPHVLSRAQIERIQQKRASRDNSQQPVMPIKKQHCTCSWCRDVKDVDGACVCCEDETSECSCCCHENITQTAPISNSLLMTGFDIQDVADPTVFFFQMPGKSPDIDGTLNCDLAPMIMLSFSIFRFEQSATNIESAKIDPTRYVQWNLPINETFLQLLKDMQENRPQALSTREIGWTNLNNAATNNLNASQQNPALAFGSGQMFGNMLKTMNRSGGMFDTMGDFTSGLSNGASAGLVGYGLKGATQPPPPGTGPAQPNDPRGQSLLSTLPAGNTTVSWMDCPRIVDTNSSRTREMHLAPFQQVQQGTAPRERNDLIQMWEVFDKKLALAMDTNPNSFNTSYKNSAQCINSQVYSSMGADSRVEAYEQFIADVYLQIHGPENEELLSEYERAIDPEPQEYEECEEYDDYEEGAGDLEEFEAPHVHHHMTVEDAREMLYTIKAELVTKPFIDSVSVEEIERFHDEGILSDASYAQIVGKMLGTQVSVENATAKRERRKETQGQREAEYGQKRKREDDYELQRKRLRNGSNNRRYVGYAEEEYEEE